MKRSGIMDPAGVQGAVGRVLMNAYTWGPTAGGGAPWPLRCQYNGVKLWDLIELRGDPIHCGQQANLGPLS